MKAFEKLISLSDISSCATASEHFCSITGEGGNINYIIRNPLNGQVQKIDILSGVIAKHKTLEGIVNITNHLQGQVQKIDSLKGILKKINNIKGDTKCQ